MSWDRPNYAIPGLMPELSPNADRLIRLNPDGSPVPLHEVISLLDGDWWDGEEFTITFSEGQPADLAQVRILFRKSSLQGEAGSWFTTGEGGGLTITDPADWVFTFDGFNVDFGPGDWYGDVECTDVDGKVYTPFTILMPVLYDATTDDPAFT